MPAEWIEHSRTFISWPVQDSMVYPEDYAAVSEWYAQIVKAIAEFEPVTVIVNPADLDRVKLIFDEDNIECLPIEHNDAWLRDNGPTFIVNEQGEAAGVNWGFNAWGGKYTPWELDDKVAPQILEFVGLPKFDAPFVM
jgi:agmatine deiminase